MRIKKTKPKQNSVGEGGRKIECCYSLCKWDLCSILGQKRERYSQARWFLITKPTVKNKLYLCIFIICDKEMAPMQAVVTVKKRRKKPQENNKDENFERKLIGR